VRVTSIWFTRMTELKVRIRLPESGPAAGRRGSVAKAGTTWPTGPGKQALRVVSPAVLMKVRRFIDLPFRRFSCGAGGGGEERCEGAGYFA